MMKTGILKSESTNKAIVVSIGLSFIAKLITFAQSVVISYAFGVQKSTDILLYTVSLVFLITTFISCVNQQVIVPNVIHIRSSTSEQGAKRFISYVYTIYIIIGIVGVSAMMISPARLLAALSEFYVQDIQSNIDILTYIIPSFFFIIANTFILDVFTAYRYFSLPMLLDMVKNILIILVVMVFEKKFNVASLAIGIFVGNLVQFIIVNAMLFGVLKVKFAFRYYKIHNAVRKNIAIVAVGQIATFLNSFIVMYLLSGFEAGIYSSMDYGQKINTIFISVVVAQISTVVGINIIECFNEKDHVRLNQIFIKYLNMGLFFLMPLCLIISINSERMVALLLERGKFSREAVQITGEFLRYFVLIVPLKFIDTLFCRLIIAKQIQMFGLFWQVGSNAIQAIVIWVLVKTFGYVGYPIGLLLSYGLYIVLFTHFLVRRHFCYIQLGVIKKYFIYNLTLNLFIYAVLYPILKIFGTSKGFMDNVVMTMATGIVYITLYLMLGYQNGTNKEIIHKGISHFKKRAQWFCHNGKLGKEA